MSLSSASGSMGGMVGAASASFLLLNYGWTAAGVFLASAAIIAAILLQRFAKDPIV